MLWKAAAADRELWFQCVSLASELTAIREVAAKELELRVRKR
jgi:hypothetical protein